MPLLRRVLLILGLGAFLVSDLHWIITREEPFRPDNDLLTRVCPDTRSFLRDEGRHGPFYADEAASGGHGHALGFVSDQVDPKVKGYSDQISLLVGLDDSGVVTGVRLISHKETPSYMRSVISSGFLEKLTGRKLGPDLAEVDAVTGATVTSDAIRQDILQGGALLVGEHFGIAVEGVPEPRSFLRSMKDPHSMALAGVILLALAAYLARSFKAGRALSLAGGLIVLGIYCGMPLSTSHFTSLAALRFPASSNAPLLLLLGFAMVTAFVFRSRVYCDYLCPYAAVQEFLSVASGRRGGVSEKVWRGSTAIRYLLLFAIALLVALGGYHAVGVMEPYVFLFNPEAELLPWIYVGAALIAALFIKRFWCRIFCPCGTCIEIVASAGGYFTRRKAVRRRVENPSPREAAPGSP